MSTTPKTLAPFPSPDIDWPPLAPLWAAARIGEFHLPRCVRCERFNWYPQETCRYCGEAATQWLRLSGRGTLFSYWVLHRPLYPALASLGPYVAAIVSIEEDPRVRFVTRIVDAEPASLRIDMPLRTRFADAGYPAHVTGVAVPLFTPA